MAKQMKSPEMLVRINVLTQQVTCQYIQDGVWKDLPKIGDIDPEDKEKIEPEPHTPNAVPIKDQIRSIKYHSHSPDCITVDIGGAQYQVCWP
jgi:hypothetical protein